MVQHGASVWLFPAELNGSAVSHGLNDTNSSES